MKRIVFILLTALLPLSIIFHQPVFNKLAAWAVQAYAFTTWGATLDYDDLSFSDGRIIIHHPRIDSPYVFHAEQMVIECELRWRRRLLHIDLNLFRPHWDLRKPPTSKTEKWVKVMSGGSKWVKVHPRFHVVQGTVSWPKEQSSDRQAMRFDLQADSCEGATVKLYSAAEVCSEPNLELRAASFSDRMEVECRFRGADCLSLFSLADFLEVPLPGWKMISGTLQGDVVANFSDLRRPHLEGELMIENGSFQLTGAPVRINLKLAKLSLEKNQNCHGFNHRVPMLTGTFEMIEPANLSYHTDENQWTLNEIFGEIRLDGNETAAIYLEARTDRLNKPSLWKLKGLANLNSSRSMNLDLALQCFSDGSPEGSMMLSLTQPEADRKQADIRLDSLSYSDLNDLQLLLSTIWHDFKSIELNGGVFDAIMEADITSQGVGEVRLKKLSASHLSSRFKPWNADFDFDSVIGHGRAHLSREDFWSTVQAGLHLENGTVHFNGIGQKLPLGNIQAHLLIQQGQIENSLVTLDFAGLKGQMDVEWSEHKQLLTFKLDGAVGDLVDFFPNFLEEGLRQHFFDHRMIVLANVKNQQDHVELEGTVHLEDPLSERLDIVHYGCTLKQETKQSRFRTSGWFYSNKLPVEKYLSPFLFYDGVLHMEGDAEFKGSFDEELLTVKYNVDNLKIENEDLLIEMQQLDASPSDDFVGDHQLDFKTFAHQGRLPIPRGTYLDKNTGLLFKDIHGSVEFKDSVIKILPVEAFCEDVYFSGGIRLDCSNSDPGVFNLELLFPVFSGRVSNLQKLIARIDSSGLLHQIPLDGEASAKAEGLSMKFDFSPGDYKLSGSVQAVVTDGSIPFESAEMNLRGIYMDVLYKHEDKLLEFKDIQGTLLIGKPMRAEEYLFLGSRLLLSNFSNPDFEIDISVWDSDDELFHLAAQSTTVADGAKSIAIDTKKSHLSSIYPLTWACKMRNWSQIESFAFRSEFDLNGLIRDLSRFKKTGFFFLSHCLIDKISLVPPIHGTGTLNIQGQSEEDFLFEIEGKEIKQKASCEHYACLKGSKRDKKWMIDHLQWDDWNAYGEFLWNEGRWKIPFLGMSIGQSLLLGLEGDLIPAEGLLHASLNFCEVDLSKLDRWNSLKPFISKWQPSGVVKGSGHLEWSCLDTDSLEGIKASFQAKATDVSFRNKPLNISGPFMVDLNMGDGKGICIHDAAIDTYTSNGHASFKLDHFQFQPVQEAFTYLKLSFEVPSDDIAEVVESLNDYFPEAFDETVKNVLERCQSEGSLKGELEVDHSILQGGLTSLKFADGTYGYDHRMCDLKQFQLNFSEGNLEFSAMTQTERCPFQLLGQMNWPDPSNGKLQFLTSDEQSPLEVIWEKRAEMFPVIKSVKGQFNGCRFNLSEDPQSSQEINWNGLKGSIDIDFNSLASLLSEQGAENLKQLKLNTPLSFSGRFWLDPALGSSLFETVYFKGSMKGEQTIVKGYQVEKMEGDVQYVPGRLDIQNLTLTDRAGSLHVPNLITRFDEERNAWSLHVPTLLLRNLRISQLRDAEGPIISAKSKFRSLVVKRIEVFNLRGDAGNHETWQAHGNLHFANPVRKNVFHPLFAIPGEILLRLGLDPSVLNPVTGTIVFNLQNDKFYLTKLKDVYSEGRGSKFYLAEGPNPSWMDFDGNLSVNIRMKQYNLIFKIAELFTVSVQGNIRKPTYTLQKLPKTHRKSEVLTKTHESKITIN